MALTVGNHDTYNTSPTAYDDYAAAPNVSQYGSSYVNGIETGSLARDYWYAYNGVLFMHLNTNNVSVAEHKAFMTEALAAYKQQHNGQEPTWKILVFHQSIFSVATHSTESEIRNLRAELAPIISELDMDAVLMGHDHSYARTYLMQGTEPVNTDASSDIWAPGEGEVLYLTLNSGSGGQCYDTVAAPYYYEAVRNQEYLANVTEVTVTDKELTFTTYRIGDDQTAPDSIVDTVTIHKEENPDNLPMVTTDALKGGMVDSAYSQTLEADGPAPISWHVTEGELPDGLQLDTETGEIFGVPVAAGSFAVTITAANAYGMDDKSFTLVVAKAPGAVVAAPALSERTADGLTVSAAAPDNGQSVEYAVSTTMTVPQTGWQEEGTFADLDPLVVYYVFARAKANGAYETGPAAFTTVPAWKAEEDKKELLRIELYAVPHKLVYETGESLDVAGAMLQLVYSDGSIEKLPVTADMISGFDPSRTGTQTLTVAYRGKTTFEITIHAEQPSIPQTGEHQTAWFALVLAGLSATLLPGVYKRKAKR